MKSKVAAIILLAITLISLTAAIVLWKDNCRLRNDLKSLHPEKILSNESIVLQNQQLSAKLKKLLISLKIPVYPELGKCDVVKLEEKADTLKLVKEQCYYGAASSEDVLNAELSLLDTLLENKDTPPHIKKALTSKYLYGLEEICKLKEAEYKAGANTPDAVKACQRRLAEFKKANNRN